MVKLQASKKAVPHRSGRHLRSDTMACVLTSIVHCMYTTHPHIHVHTRTQTKAIQNYLATVFLPRLNFLPLYIFLPWDLGLKLIPHYAVHQVNDSHAFLNDIYLFMLYMVVGMGTGMPQYICDGRRTSCWSQFFLLLCGSRGWNSGH